MTETMATAAGRMQLRRRAAQRIREMGPRTAWDLIGFGGDVLGEPASVRIVGGRTLYEAVDYDDSRGGRRVRLSRLAEERDDIGAVRLRQINRYVDPETPMEVIIDRIG